MKANRMLAGILVLWLLMDMGGAVIFAQDPAPPKATAEKAAAPVDSARDGRSAPEPKVLKAVVVTAEMQELLADRQTLLNEIERITGLAGEAVKIPASQQELSKRAEAKWQRFLGWVDAQGVPRDKSVGGLKLVDGWTYASGTFTPPKSPKAEEKKP